MKYFGCSIKIAKSAHFRAFWDAGTLVGVKWRFPPGKVRLYSEESSGLLGASFEGEILPLKV